MSEPRATLSINLNGAFTNSTELGGFSQDDILFHVVDVVADTLFLDDYELREVLDASLPMSYPLEQESGEVVMSARSDNVGGPLDATKSAELLARLADLGREHTLTGPLALLLPHDRAVVLPPPTLAGVFELSDGHPLRGAPYFSVIDVMKLLDLLIDADPENAGRVLPLLELCREARIPLSWRRAESA
jgi:hypothetical protein